ncbi:hypothetical protein [Sphingomonas sp. Leaf28]|uniref:hypothetical protein n=1 Tax=Sphingomonas sp. Leaf28 TaxID=1735695 RepID=UPI0012E2BEA7|nr:hypothetical protein [Sphingomonas sp. Leaf28]
MADDKKTAEPKADGAVAEKLVCGIIMPIAGDGDYTSEHWRRVQRIIVRSIEKAGMTVRLVWESPEVDVIHARILQGIYESDVVVCDVSGLNPNVMLELGLRLSTKRPTVVITDSVKKPPFDIGVFQYHSYQRDLEYNAVDSFIDEISKKITQVAEAFEQKRYKSFVENFTFEVVEPTEVSVPADVAIRERMESFSRQLSRIEKLIGAEQRIEARSEAVTMTWESYCTEESAKQIVSTLTRDRRVLGVAHNQIGHKASFTVAISSTITPVELAALRKWIQDTIDHLEDIPF